MGMTSSLFRAAALLLSLTSASFAIPVDSVKVDLKPLIRAASDNRVQFAVHVPHKLSLVADGHWRNFPARNLAEWHYAIRIPTAVSMSFYASQIHLPAHAYLTVRSARTTIVYQSLDLRRSDLWSRVQPGDSLEFTLSVPSAERSSAKLEIESFQAGYRALGTGAKDHPYFQRLKQLSTAADNTGCIQNYQCNVTTGNAVIAGATVGIVIENVYQCTGTLINDVPGDNTPYVLTARHCENGVLGGGAPSNAENLTVYWNATTPCGSTLGSIYDPGIATQTGATTSVEQQDAWLVKLDESPVVTDAQFAGFDASGAAVTGGYSVHHALGHNKQLTQWFGQAYLSQQSDVLGSNYVSNLLETVNQLGNVGPGASGSGLIDGHDRLVGTLTLGRTSDDPSGYESCPVHPAAPNGSNGAADFTSLAAVWNSTADPTVGPSAPTLKSVLDPSNSGTLIVASSAAAHLNFTASSHSLTDGDSLVLSWDAVSATQCMANGGANSDGWSGTLPGSGNLTLTETFGGSVSYGLSCQLSGGRVVNAAIKVFWYGGVPFVFLDSFPIVWTGANATLTWSSNVAPCSISGGSLALSNLASSGSTTTTENTPGTVNYTITCGSSPIVTRTLTQTYVTPALTFRANGTDRRSGEPLFLYWASYAQSCIPAGGAPADGWTNSTFGPANEFSPRVTALGTYTYTLTCFAGPNQVSASVTITLENDAPYTTASVNPTTVVFSDSPADYLSIGWKTNLSSCIVNSNPYTLDGESTTYPLLPSGASDAEDIATFSPSVPGTYVITVTCESEIGPQNATSAAPITVNVLPPPPPTVTISSNASTVVQGQNFTLTWSSTNAQNCTTTGSGGLIGVIWDGTLPPSGSQVEGAMFGGQSTLGITCQSIDPNQVSVSAQTTITVTSGPQPTATLSVNPVSVAQGQSFTLTWSSTNAASCAANGGGAGETGWSGVLPTSGSLAETASVEGVFTYTLTCSSAGGTNVQSQATLTVTAASTGTPAAAGGGKSGGGTIETRDLILLALLLGLTCLRGKSHRPNRTVHCGKHLTNT